MNYPINFSFKLLALSSQITITDGGGNLLGYAKQKKFKLKEDIRIFTDASQTTEIYSIKADKIIDFSAKYSIFDSQDGGKLGAIRRRGMKSLWSATYEITDAQDAQIFEVKEANAWVKIIDGVAGEIPVLGMFTGYFFNPSYIIKNSRGGEIAKLDKQPAMFEGKFQLTQLGQMSEAEENLLLLSLLMMTLLERSRG